MIKINDFCPKISLCRTPYNEILFSLEKKWNQLWSGWEPQKYFLKLKRKKELLRIYVKEMTFELWMWWWGKRWPWSAKYLANALILIPRIFFPSLGISVAMWWWGNRWPLWPPWQPLCLPSWVNCFRYFSPYSPLSTNQIIETRRRFQFAPILICWGFGNFWEFWVGGVMKPGQHLFPSNSGSHSVPWLSPTQCCSFSSSLFSCGFAISQFWHCLLGERKACCWLVLEKHSRNWIWLLWKSIWALN